MMTYKKEPSDSTRITNLKELISDNKRLRLGFSKPLVRRYIIELADLVSKRAKDKRKAQRMNQERDIFISANNLHYS